MGAILDKAMLFESILMKLISIESELSEMFSIYLSRKILINPVLNERKDAGALRKSIASSTSSIDGYSVVLCLLNSV